MNPYSLNCNSNEGGYNDGVASTLTTRSETESGICDVVWTHALPGASENDGLFGVTGVILGLDGHGFASSRRIQPTSVLLYTGMVSCCALCLLGKNLNRPIFIRDK